MGRNVSSEIHSFSEPTLDSAYPWSLIMFNLQTMVLIMFNLQAVVLIMFNLQAMVLIMFSTWTMVMTMSSLPAMVLTGAIVPDCDNIVNYVTYCGTNKLYVWCN